MKKKSNFVSMFVMISVMGLVISFLNGDFEIGSYFEGLEINNLEVLLDTLNIGLGFLALVILLIFIFYRLGRQEKDQYSKPGREDNREEKF
ncbi:MAG: hypothetical protein WBC47_04515 [Dehalococcoidia bacterium]